MAPAEHAMMRVFEAPADRSSIFSAKQKAFMSLVIFDILNFRIRFWAWVWSCSNHRSAAEERRWVIDNIIGGW